MINNRFNVVYHLLGLVKLLFYKLKNRNMKMEELFEMYKNLDMKERIKFDREYNKFKEEEKLEQLTKRKELVEELNNVINEEGQPYFSSEWVEKNILNSKQ
jgi:hypothetical protein